MRSQTPAKSPDEKRSTFACAAAVAADSVSGTSGAAATVFAVSAPTCPAFVSVAPSALPQAEHEAANTTAARGATNDFIAEG